ncbi:hypothetical protein GALMADRAFT_74058 [Galerina marginata CBS 339.88]|uniref:Uncharacterized protein n=1 Tax=Galerina marginata (strain CBS 339.88) TaxID=685588 RepID=A0A067SX66_GALM3|nr:hypothetical protein GALMADRAFT_74058 [Galerina marginata CBS 339.88]
MFLLLAILYAYQGNAQATPLHFPYQDLTLGASPLPLPSCKDTRSLWDIIWSCLVTSFACSWVSVHPNIPAPGEGRVMKGLRKFELMLWSILSPELIIMWAVRQWLGARRLEAKYSDRGWTKTHGYFIQMGGFRLYEGDISLGILSAERFGTLLEKGRINMPTITEAEIQDRSKGDGLAKALVIVQTTWFITQCIARRASGLVLTQLELITLALAALNSIMYFFWWNKPLDVQSTVPVYLLETSTNRSPSDSLTTENDESASEGESSNLFCLKTLLALYSAAEEVYISPEWRAFTKIVDYWPLLPITKVLTRMEHMAQLRSDPKVDGLERVPTFYALPIPVIGSYDWMNVMVVAGVSVVGSLFGAVHCVGWSFFFPTDGEATTWRVLSIIVAGAPLAGIWALLPHFAYRIPESPRLRNIFSDNYVFFMFIPPYVLARIGLLVEAFILLRDLPDGANDVVTWTTFIPHV